MKRGLLLTSVTTPLMVPTLSRHFTVHVKPVHGDWRPAILPVAERIEALVTTTFVGAEGALIDALPNLAVVVNAGGHTDTTDVAAVRARGLPMANTPGLSTEDVADATFGLALHAARRICEGDRFVRAGRWPRESMPFGMSLTGKVFGVLGLGRIGRAVARRAAAFDMDVRYHGPREKPDAPYPYVPDPVTLAREADVLAVTCGTGPTTRNIVGDEVLAALGPQGILATVARGCVDQDALVAALTEGRLGAAGVDVFVDEPNVPEALLALDNVVLTPHYASGTREAKRQQVDTVLENLLAHFAGRPLVTPLEDHPAPG